MTMQMTNDAVVPEWTIADRLRKAREFAGLGQIDFAEETGMSRASISRYERGLATPPKSAMLLWQMRTGVSVEWILTGCTPRDLNPEPTDYGFKPLAILPPKRLPAITSLAA